jgi:phenylalanine-4-hydroxylase
MDLSLETPTAAVYGESERPGLIPELPFFRLLANRKFPVTDWIRKPAEFDYVVEPDVFHDLFGHVPMLFDPIFADYASGAMAKAVSRHTRSVPERNWHVSTGIRWNSD